GLHPLRVHVCYGVDDVARGQRNVLHAGPAVVIQVFLDLRPGAPAGGLVDGKLDPLVAVGHDFGHERGVFRADVRVVEVLVDAEAQDLVVKPSPGVDLAPADITH